MEHPVVRPLEPVPIDHGEQRFIALRDNTGLSAGMVLLQPAAYFLLQFMDGKHNRSEIRQRFTATTGLELPEEMLENLLAQLDEHLVLDGPRAREALARHSLRPAAHAGSAYPSDPAELKLFLDGVLGLDPNGVGEVAGRLAGVLAPHIDIRRGAACYSQAFSELRARRPERILAIVLGISHSASRTPFILTRKDFETPLGPVPTDLAVVDELAAACDFDPFTDEYNHLGEHSVEFQAVFLRHLYPSHLRMVPILCGSFHRPLLEGGLPEDIAGVPAFFSALKRVVEGHSEEAVIIASVDLAHVGVRFGGSPLSEQDLAALAVADRESLARAVEGDAPGFFATLQADGGARSYCGTSAIYTMLRVLDTSGTLHRYDQCNEPGNVSSVTIAAAGYYK